MNVFFLPVGNNDLYVNPPSANLSGWAIAESGFCGDPAVGGLGGGAARGMVMMKRFHAAKKAPAEAGAFFHQK